MADVKQWITIKGRHIPIFEGESKADAIKRLKEGARKGKEKQQEMHSKDKQAKKEAFDKAREKQKKKHQAMEKEPTERRKEAYKKAAEDTIEKKQAFEDAMSGKVKAKFRKKHMNESESQSKAAKKTEESKSLSFEKREGYGLNPAEYKLSNGDGISPKSLNPNEGNPTNIKQLKDISGRTSRHTDEIIVKSNYSGKEYTVTREHYKDTKTGYHRAEVVDIRRHIPSENAPVKKSDPKKKSFEEATARLKAKESPYQRLKTLQDHDYEELTAAEKKELKSLQEKAYKGELNKKAVSSSRSDAISKTASRLQKKGFNDPESIEKHLRELSPVRRNRLAKELGVEGRGDEKIKAMTQKIHEAQGGKKAEGSKVDLQSLKSYGYDPSDATGDPTVIETSNGSFYKIGNNKWNEHSKQGRALGGTYTDEQIAEKLKSASDVKVFPSKKDNAKSWQDKDAEDKAKQIATHQKAADERNGKKYNSLIDVRNTDRGRELIDRIEEAEEEMRGRGLKDGDDDPWVRVKENAISDLKKEFDYNWERPKGDPVKALRTMGEKAEIRKIVTSEQAFEGKQVSWIPKTGDKISDVGHNEAQNKLYGAPVGTTFEMTSRDGDYVGEYTKQSDGSWKGSQKYKSGYKMPPTVYTPKGFAMNVVGNDIKVTNNGSEKKADWKDVDTKPQKSKKVNLSTTYTNAMNSVDADKVERAIAKLTKNGGSSAHIKDLEEKLRRLRHSEYKEDPTHYNGKGMY